MRAPFAPLAVAALVAAAAAASAAAPPARWPAEWSAWIAQLGSEDERTREDAAKRRGALEEDALPLLRRARRSHDDPDVRLRAILLIAAVERLAKREVRSYSGH